MTSLDVILLVALAGTIAALVVRSRVTPIIAAITESSPDAMLTVNEAGVILAANQRVSAIFGYERSELVGRPIEMLVPERLRASHPSLRRGFMTKGVARRMGERGVELKGVRKDGSEVAV